MYETTTYTSSYPRVSGHLLCASRVKLAENQACSACLSRTMGLLVNGVPLTWPASEPYRRKVKVDGVTQFLNIFKAAKDIRSPTLKWGDEVEYMLVKFDRKSRRVRALLSAPALLEELQRDEHAKPHGCTVPVLWRPEYANWMIEGTPGVPYRCYAADLVLVERNMALRRQAVQDLLQPDESVLTISSFPQIGGYDFTYPCSKPGGLIARSFFVSDDVINPHPRFATLTRNIRTRRGRKVDIRVPLFIDKYTLRDQPLLPANPFHLLDLVNSSINSSSQASVGSSSSSLISDVSLENKSSSSPGTSDSLHKSADLSTVDKPVPTLENDYFFTTLEEAQGIQAEDEIVMDAAAFGMGCCCLQVTLQANDISEARYLYDQLAVIAPIMLSLTAATPVVRGMLADTDARWNIIAAAMDDRKDEEALSGTVPKSRYSSIDCFISERGYAHADSYNDIPAPIDDETYRRLRENDVDHLLAQHIAHLFIRDPLVIYGDHVEQDNARSNDHFENIQSTNWNTVRFKPPPAGSDIGWRTEFRSMEVGLTDFENAAFCVFIVLLSRVILAFDLKFYIPMSRVDNNMSKAHRRNSVQEEKFFFRRNIFSSKTSSSFVCACGHIHDAATVPGDSGVFDVNEYCQAQSDSDSSDAETEPFDLMTINEIFNGKSLCSGGKYAGYAFPGLIRLVRGYLNAIHVDTATRARLMTYLDFVSDRAAGKLCTTASFIRDFVRHHKDYRLDSVVTNSMSYDLLQECRSVTSGEKSCPELLGRYDAERFTHVDTSESMMEHMVRELNGAEAATLMGASLPSSALTAVLNDLASDRMVAPCGGC